MAASSGRCSSRAHQRVDRLRIGTLLGQHDAQKMKDIRMERLPRQNLAEEFLGIVKMAGGVMTPRLVVFFLE